MSNAIGVPAPGRIVPLRLGGILLLLCLCAGLGMWMAGRKPEAKETAYVAPGVRMEDVRFESAALGRAMPYRVFLPERIPAGVRLPVVYLLHGRGPDYHDWSVNSDVSKYALPGKDDSEAAGHGLILVMPEGGESFYVNAAEQSKERWEDYLVRDLPADVERRFPARGDRAGKAIVGISMGGFGAMVQGLRHPESYAFAAGLSAAVDVPERRFILRRLWQWRLFRSIFGPMGSAARAERDPFVLATKADPAQAPYFYVTTGKEEALYEPDRRFAETLRAHDFASEFHALPGGHAWKQWQSQLPGCFARWRAVLREPAMKR